MLGAIAINRLRALIQYSNITRGCDKCRRVIYVLPDGFLFPLGNLFSIGIDNLGATHAVWGKGRIVSRQGSIRYTRKR